ncbi:DUF6232 family protein [Microseira sp. BLCC-F43]|jgi:hypothetical protein|uniref:DUF6232 family protein n=1 Tax=Microseira sp. BLCC-F43 TaxID=3153602 RepID=UPI0035B75E16
MTLSTFLQGDDKTSIEKAEVLYITKKTVRFGDDVYQFRNVTGFGIGEVQTKKIPYLFIFVLFVLGAIVGNFAQEWGGILIMISIAALIYNIAQPKMYGLKLYLNSGDGKIFITSDTAWLKKAVMKLYDFTENAQDGSSMTIQIGGSITGNIIQGGKVGGDVSSKH